MNPTLPLLTALLLAPLVALAQNYVTRPGSRRTAFLRPIVIGLLSTLILLTALPGRPAAAAEGVQKYKPTMTSRQLEEKARRLENLLETKIVRQHGLIPMFVRADDYQLPTAADYEGAYRHRHLDPASQKKAAWVLRELGIKDLKARTEEEISIPPMHVWRAWENTATDTAYYLAAMAYKYRCTGDARDLTICRRTFGAMKYIFNLTAEKGERGRLCKPYGGVWSNQSSLDQTQCVSWGLAAYRHIAPPDDLADYHRMITEAADYNIKTGYIEVHGYFGWTREMLFKQRFGDENWSRANWNNGIRSLVELWLAWHAGGDPRFLKEIQRWYDKCGVAEGPAGYEFALYLGALMMELDPHHHKVWTDMMHGYFARLPYPVSPGQIFGRNAISAMGCVTAQRWFPELDMISYARCALEQLDEDSLRFLKPGLIPDHAKPGDTLKQWEIESKLIDGDSLTAWLAAYWEGRWRGYW
jgi:hypothetical protein